ncbi:MAG TPA: biotin--[acetyl-CoA-carboxylase] ligase [Saprospiraceae bacterium]|nr:biotin--[acetyl-CoA-carboxylase] ligase [Saprospirales bacterium]HRQ30471.1 biotin--[acetyl-CoA-carboxylase] ligase [Saprospiraceae bacterium]
MQIIGSHRIYLESINSTSTFAQELLSKSNPNEGTVISAGYQTSGKGQGSNKWQSEADKNILLSFILYPKFLKASKQFYLSIFVANAIVNWLDKIIPEQPVRIKWPNDIYVGHQKLGGILIQNTLKADAIEHAVIGIGLNVMQQQFGELSNAVSLSMLTPLDQTLAKLTDDLILQLDHYYRMLANGNFAWQKSAFEQRMLHLGEKASVSTSEGMVEGIVLGIGEDGKIVMNVDGVVRKLGH